MKNVKLSMRRKHVVRRRVIVGVIGVIVFAALFSLHHIITTKVTGRGGSFLVNLLMRLATGEKLPPLV